MILCFVSPQHSISNVCQLIPCSGILRKYCVTYKNNRQIFKFLIMDTQVVPSVQNLYNSENLHEDIKSKLRSGSKSVSLDPNVELIISRDVEVNKPIQNESNNKDWNEGKASWNMRTDKPRRRKRALLNVGGERHEISWELLGNFPHTRVMIIAQITNIGICYFYTVIYLRGFFFNRSS